MEDPNLGPIDIFRCNTTPYDYLLDYKKQFVENDERVKKYLQLTSQIKNMDHKNLVKIHLCQLQEEVHVCIKNKQVHTYCSYYNFTLAEAINKKKIQECRFPEAELVYIMGCLVELALFLKRFGIAVGDYRPGNIYLSPEGYLKVYLLEVEEDNKHGAYYKALAERDKIEEHVFAPEQLTAMNNLEYETKYDLYKADLFSVGMVLLELITLDKTKFYYNDTRTELKMGRIEFDLSTLTSHISQPFLGLLRQCLQPDPQKRFSLEEANEALNYIRKSSKSTSYCIRLNDDEEKNKRGSAKKESNPTSMKGQFILNGLEKRLTPSPITTLSSSVSSGFNCRNNSSRARESHRIGS